MADPQYLTMKEAQQELRVSKNKMWLLVKDGVIATIENPLDRRQKLVRRSDLDWLAKFARRGQGRTERRG